MSFGATHDAKEQVRQAIDIVELVGSYLPLRRQGRLYVGICPWHDDSRPSLQVNPERQSWKCWVCNLGGDVFSFIMQREGVEFREALTILADRAGLTLPSSRPQSRETAGGPLEKQTLYEVVAWAERQFRDCLNSSPAGDLAGRYFDERGINRESRAAFHLGFSPNQWQWLLDRARSTSFPPAALEAAGLVGKSTKSDRYYDRFKGRAIFPIRDTQGRPIGFGGRTIPELDDSHAAEVCQLARVARVFQERSCFWSRSGPRRDFQEPERRGCRGLYRYDYGSSTWSKKLRGRDGHCVGAESHPAAEALRRYDHSGARR